MYVWQELLAADNQAIVFRLAGLLAIPHARYARSGGVGKRWGGRGKGGKTKAGGGGGTRGGMFCRVEGMPDLAGIVHELLQLFLAIIPLGDQAGPTRGLGAAGSHACTYSQAMLLCKK